MQQFLSFHLSLIFLFCLGASQLTATFSSGNINIFPTVTVRLYEDPNSPYHPSDFYLATQTSVINLYTLGSNQILEIYDKINPSIRVETFSNLSYANSPTHKLANMAVDETDNLLVLTSYNNTIVQHLIYNISTAGVTQYFQTFGGNPYPSPPIYVFRRQNRIYSYHQNVSGNDRLHIVDLYTNYTQDTSMGVENYRIAVTPDKTQAVLWNNVSHLRIYEAYNFALLRQYTLSVTAGTNSTNNIAFSADSTLAILQTDTAFPIRVIQLSTGATLNNITATGTVYSAVFLEASKRFILVHQTGGSFVYDRNTDTSVSFTGLISDDPLFVDTAASELFSVGSSSVQCYGINITVDNVSLSGHSTPAGNVSYVPPVQPPVSEQTPDTQDIYQSSFYVEVNYSQTVNRTLTDIVLTIDSVDDTVQTIFSVILSTPLAVYFFSSFNYFTLSSLYVLLSIKMPKIVYSYLSIIFTSSQADVLQQVGVSYTFPCLSDEKVDESRPSYLGVTSDILPPNLVAILLIPLNMILFESVILLTGRKGFSVRKVHQVLVVERIGIYWGLIRSLMIPLLLPWTFSFPKGNNNLLTVVNSAIQLLLLCLFTFFVLASFLRELRLARHLSKNRCFKLALREWWSSYETYVYSVSLLLPNPLYFIVIVGLSNYFALYLSFSASKYKVLQILKAFYPIVFHGCFAAFTCTSNHDVLMWSSLVCLGVFLLGSFHHLLQAVIVFCKLIYKIAKVLFFKGKVRPLTEKPSSKKKRSKALGKDSRRQHKGLALSTVKQETIFDQSRQQDYKPSIKVSTVQNFQKTAKSIKNKKVKFVREGDREGRKHLAMTIKQKPKSKL